MTTKHHQHKHHFIHDLSLLKTLIMAWLGVLLAAMAVQKGLHVFPEYASLLPTFSSSSSYDASDSDSSWTYLESHGDVALLRRPIVSSSTATELYAHRAVAANVDLPIEALLHVFRDTPNNVSLLLFNQR
jgi:hypothetical protein